MNQYVYEKEKLCECDMIHTLYMFVLFSVKFNVCRNLDATKPGLICQSILFDISAGRSKIIIYDRVNPLAKYFI